MALERPKLTKNRKIEKSFEDLLTGLSDESDDDIDDLVDFENLPEMCSEDTLIAIAKTNKPYTHASSMDDSLRMSDFVAEKEDFKFEQSDTQAENNRNYDILACNNNFISKQSEYEEDKVHCDKLIDFHVATTTDTVKTDTKNLFEFENADVDDKQSDNLIDCDDKVTDDRNIRDCSNKTLDDDYYTDLIDIEDENDKYEEGNGRKEDEGREDGEKEDNNADLVITVECCDDTVDMDQDTEDISNELKRDESIDLDALVQDNMQLDVDMGKQKTALRKRGSLAKRRKPSRSSIHSMGEAGEDSHFTDSTGKTSFIKFISEVRQNYSSLVQEWNQLNKEIEEKIRTRDTLIVGKDDLAQLATEVAQLRDNLPLVLNKKVITAATRIDQVEEELQNAKRHVETKQLEASQWKARCEVVTADCQKEKEENIKLKCEVQELTQQLSQQSDYCSSLGSACCTLLWRVSKNEESIQSILVGTKVDEFLCLVTNTLESYLSAYKDEWPHDTSEEQSFILALCGIITNIAASALGRDFLVSNQYGRQLMDTYLKVLSDAPNGKAAKLKNLVLMSLYNISINQKGIKYICTKKGLLSLLSWIIQDEKIVENRVNSLRLIQSIMCEDINISLIPELEEAIPSHMFEELLQEKNKDIKELALEILSDIQQHKRHQP